MSGAGALIVGLDVGTTAVKAVAFGIDAPRRHLQERDYPLLSPQPGWLVQDPEAVAAAVFEALAALANEVGGAAVEAVGVSTAMHGLIGLDDRHRPLTPLVTWADGRAAGEARELRERGLAAALHRETGTPVHSMSPLTKIMWFARNDPGLFAKVRWWIGLKDFVLLRLTGRLVTELSSASATGLLAMATRQWSPTALDLCGISADRLPEVLATTAVLPLGADAATRCGLRSGTPVVTGAGDGPLGNLGTGAMGPGEAAISLGTSGAVRTVVDAPAVDDGGALFCYALTDAHWVVGGAISNGGSVVDWALEALAGELEVGDFEAIMALAAEAPPGCDGLVMLPYLLPERAPFWDPTLPGAYLGLRAGHTRAHLVRAALEGVCMQLATIVAVVDRFAPVTSLRATGGAFRAPLWREMMAAALGRPLHVIAPSGGTALGAAALALFALGRTANVGEGAHRLAPDSSDADAVLPDPVLVEVYRRSADGIPALIDALQVVARSRRR